MKKKRVFGILLSLALMLTMMPALSMSQTVHAADSTKAYADYDVTTDANKDKSGEDLAALQVTFNGCKWYIIKDESTAMDAGEVTLLAADDRFGESKFDSEVPYEHDYNQSTAKKYLDEVIAGTAGEGKPDFSRVADAMIDTSIGRLYLMSIEGSRSVPVNVKKFSHHWWLRSPGGAPVQVGIPVVMLVKNDGTIYTALDNRITGVPVRNSYFIRPATRLDLSKVAFDSGTNTFSLKPVSYMEWNDTDKKVEKAATPCSDYIVVNADTTTFEDGKWYVARDEVVNANRITVSGTAHLILEDGAKLTASKGITVESDNNALNIYPGSMSDTIECSGELIANVEADSKNAAIGSLGEVDAPQKGGTVTIHGGKVTASGGTGGAGIGGGASSSPDSVPTGHTGHGGTVTINGGEVTANGGSNGAGIGGARLCNGGTVTINGGTVNATGGHQYAKGIGAGISATTDGHLTLGTDVKLWTSADNKTWEEKTSQPAYRQQYMLATDSPHTHEFTTYAASGTTITATCANTDHACTLDDGQGNHTATLTIAAPYHTIVGDGKDPAAVVTGISQLKDSASVRYYTKNGDTYGSESVTPPTDEGEYKASVTLGDATASVEYRIIKEYSLWIGGEQVTSANMSGNGWSYTPANESAEPASPARLKLNNYSYSNGSYDNSAIYTNEALTIQLEGTNEIDSTKDDTNAHAIFATEDLIIEGSGTLTAKGTSAGIVDYYNVSIQGSTVVAMSNTKSKTGYDGGILAIFGDITINNGSVEASSEAANAIDACSDVIIEGSTVEAHAADARAFGILSYDGSVLINEGSKVTATGGDHAINGKVKNEIEGTGWSNVEGTEGESLIAVSEDPGATLDYKKVMFPKYEPVPSDTTPTSSDSVAVGSVQKVGAVTYVVKSDNTVWLKKAVKNKKSFTVPATVKINKKTFKVSGISAKAFKGTKVKTLTVKTKKLTKKSVKGSLKGSKVKTVKVKVGSKKVNKKYVKKYKKIFTKKNCGKKVTVKR